MQSTDTNVRAIPAEGPVIGTYETTDELTKCPPYREDG